jgi:sugar phosphate isomerase/epimerase
MRYAACNELVHDRPFAEACALIARHGYQGIELPPYSLADDPLRFRPHERERSAKSSGTPDSSAWGSTGC